jgi:hypothetical protein
MMMPPMMEQDDNKADQIDQILRSLPPAPEAWVLRAQEIPQLERALSSLSERPRGGHAEAELRRALEEVGLEPDLGRLHALARLQELRGNR